MAKSLKLKCPVCRSPEACVVERLSPVEAARFIFLDEEGGYDLESMEDDLFIHDCRTVEVRYTCSECGTPILEGRGLPAMRNKLWAKLKEMNK